MPELGGDVEGRVAWARVPVRGEGVEGLSRGDLGARDGEDGLGCKAGVAGGVRLDIVLLLAVSVAEGDSEAADDGAAVGGKWGDGGWLLIVGALLSVVGGCSCGCCTALPTALRSSARLASE